MKASVDKELRDDESSEDEASVRFEMLTFFLLFSDPVPLDNSPSVYSLFIHPSCPTPRISDHLSPEFDN